MNTILHKFLSLSYYWFEVIYSLVFEAIYNVLLWICLGLSCFEKKKKVEEKEEKEEEEKKEEKEETWALTV